MVKTDDGCFIGEIFDGVIQGEGILMDSDEKIRYMGGFKDN